MKITFYIHESRMDDFLASKPVSFTGISNSGEYIKVVAKRGDVTFPSVTGSVRVQLKPL